MPFSDQDVGIGPIQDSSQGPSATPSQGRSDKDVGVEPPPPSVGTQPLWSGSVFPVSQYPGRSPGLDWNAGLTGAVGNAFTLPHDVATGAISTSSQDFPGRVANAAMLATPGAPGVLGRAAVPSAAALRQTATGQYKALANLGVELPVSSIADFANNAQNSLFNAGFNSTNDKLGKSSFDILHQLANPPAGATSVPLSQLENARSMFTGLAADSQGKEAAAANHVRGLIDDFYGNLSSNNVLSGDADQAASIAKQARGNWAAAKRSNTLTTTEQAAENQQRPTADALRGYLRTMIDPRHPERLAEFSQPEKDAIASFVQPSATQNTLGTIGRTFVGPGNEIKPLWAIAGEQAAQHGSGESLLAGIAGLAAPYAAGRMANAAREGLAARQFQNVDQLVRSRSPAYQAIANQAGVPNWEASAGLGAVRAMSPSPQTREGLGSIRPVALPPRPPAYPGAPNYQLFD